MQRALLCKLGPHSATRWEPGLCPQPPAYGLLIQRVVAKVILPCRPEPSCVAQQQKPKESGAT